MRTFTRVLSAIVILVVVVLVIGYAVMLSGHVNVAADAPPRKMLNHMLQMTSDNAVRRQAKSVQVPDISTTEQFLVGFRHYDEMCVMCHGAPGVLPSEVGMGLSPHPPKLYRAGDLSPAEIYWIVRHGVDMTGMPSFGRTHDDDALWAMTAFTVRLPHVSPQQYDSLRQIFAGVPSVEDGDNPH
jgi:mono/diheme cytochrome c family protein